jgi:hypothetical protein
VNVTPPASHKFGNNELQLHIAAQVLIYQGLCVCLQSTSLCALAAAFVYKRPLPAANISSYVQNDTSARQHSGLNKYDCTGNEQYSTVQQTTAFAFTYLMSSLEKDARH